MFCKKHNLPLRLICDEYVCGMCYQDIILSEKSVARDSDIEFRLIPDPSGHNIMKAKAFRRGKEIKE